MAEQTFRSPGFFDREIDLSQRQSSPSGIPAGIIGTADRGPAFIPITVGSFEDFDARFGSLDPKKAGPYAVNEFLKTHRACTYVRVLGCGANQTTADITTTETEGTVKNAGFTLSGSVDSSRGSQVSSLDRRADGAVQFLLARHFVSASMEALAFPQFSDNESFPGTVSGDDHINLVRAVLFTTTGSRFQVLDHNKLYTEANSVTDTAQIVTTAGTDGMPASSFKLVLSCSDGASYTTTDKQAGVKVLTCSLDPHSNFYVGKILNTDPSKFREKKHLLYADFAVDHEVAPLALSRLGDRVHPSIIIASGSVNTSQTSGNKTKTFQEAFGTFATRYTTPRTTMFISQPFGAMEHDLFYFETISDGGAANTKFKVSIRNIRASIDEAYQYPTFDVELREFDDTDTAPGVIERFSGLSLDPASSNYIARVIGDKKAFFNFDAADESERRVVITGKFPNRSRYVRVRMARRVELGDVPVTSAPFGFRGIPALKTNINLTDDLATSAKLNGQDLGPGTTPVNSVRLAFCSQSYKVDHADDSDSDLAAANNLSGSIIPPLPYRFKVTRGSIRGVQGESVEYAGQAGTDEKADLRFYWGVQNVSVPKSGTFGSPNNDVFRPNEGTTYNRIVEAYTRFAGIKKLDTLVTGTGADIFNSNKFTLARVALANGLDTNYHISNMTGSAKDHMKAAAYIRNGAPDTTNYTIKSTALGSRGRITLATLINSSSAVFNRFTGFAKFTNVFYGGFDGLNILNDNQARMTDRASSTRTGGGMAATDYTDTGLHKGNTLGTKTDNSIVRAYRTAARVMTDHHLANATILAIPGIRDKTVSDYTMSRCKDNGQVFYVMDSELFDENGARIYNDTKKTPASVRDTSEKLSDRNIDNNFVATYFPDVFIEDTVNNRNVEVPASVAAVGALGFNDSASRPWFAPAGFSRGALGFVTNVKVRLSAGDRDTLYDARINPIATFPNAGFVIFGQKNLQGAKSALDRINVRRMLIEVKRLVFGVARSILFEQNTTATRARFISQATPLLAMVQAGQGIEQFKIIMDDTNNTVEDVEANRLNGKIVVVPTRAVEFVAIDFIITATGVSFE